MKKILIMTALLASASLFASGHGASDTQCDDKYNKCMADCSVKYGSDSRCVRRCSVNYKNCEAGLKTENFAPQKAPAAEESTPKEEKAHH